MLHAAHASRYHWGNVGEPVNLARGEWLCSRVYAVLAAGAVGLACPSLPGAADRTGGGEDWDVAAAYEALARAYATRGDRPRPAAGSKRHARPSTAIAESERPRAHRGRPGHDRVDQAPGATGDSISAACPQWRKWRTPVTSIAAPAFSTTSRTSASRTEPPGWAKAVTPASRQTWTASGNG